MKNEKGTIKGAWKTPETAYHYSIIICYWPYMPGFCKAIIIDNDKDHCECHF